MFRIWVLGCCSEPSAYPEHGHPNLNRIRSDILILKLVPSGMIRNSTAPYGCLRPDRLRGALSNHVEAHIVRVIVKLGIQALTDACNSEKRAVKPTS